MIGRLLCIGASGAVLACSDAPAPTAPELAATEIAAPEPAKAPVSEPSAPDRAALRVRANAIFGVLPEEATSARNPTSEEKVALGRMLYYDPRLSKDQDVSCNSCHPLDRFGVDGQTTSPDHRGRRGERNAPTVYNAALNVAQFWDGRAADVEDQVKAAVLNPNEATTPEDSQVLVVLNAIPAYAPLFAAAFPDEDDSISIDNVARALGAFERGLSTPSRFDAFLEGEETALNELEIRGLQSFFSAGCIQCHVGPALGGISFQKLGRNEPYPTDDPGRFEVTRRERDRFFFKVPSLRNVAETGPWFHDGGVESLAEAVHLMSRHQLGRELSPEQVAPIVAFMGSLTGAVDPVYIEPPVLPASGADTAAADPNQGGSHDHSPQ